MPTFTETEAHTSSICGYVECEYSVTSSISYQKENDQKTTTTTHNNLKRILYSIDARPSIDAHDNEYVHSGLIFTHMQIHNFTQHDCSTLQMHNTTKAGTKKSNRSILNFYHIFPLYLWNESNEM